MGSDGNSSWASRGMYISYPHNVEVTAEPKWFSFWERLAFLLGRVAIKTVYVMDAGETRIEAYLTKAGENL